MFSFILKIFKVKPLYLIFVVLVVLTVNSQYQLYSLRVSNNNLTNQYKNLQDDYKQLQVINQQLNQDVIDYSKQVKELAIITSSYHAKALSNNEKIANIKQQLEQAITLSTNGCNNSPLDKSIVDQLQQYNK